MVLVTAFEAFGYREENVSQKVLELLPDEIAGEKVEKLLLPVSFRRAPEVILDAVERLRPRLVVAMGEARSRKKVSIERRAVNEQLAKNPDNDGDKPQGREVVKGGVKELFTEVDVDEIEGIVVSDDAGRYVCNTVYYRLLAAGVRCVFLHLPG